MFWLITILYLTTTPPVYNFLWKAIQEGEMFGIWQRVIIALEQRRLFKLADFIGGCQVCFAHFIAWLGYITWVVINWDVIGYWSLLLWMPIIPTVWYINLLSKHVLDSMAEKAEKLKRENEL